MSTKTRVCLATIGMAVCMIMRLASAHANRARPVSMCGSCGQLPKAEVDEYKFLEVPLSYRLSSWFVVDVDGDGSWEIAAKTDADPALYGVFDPSNSDWIAEPVSTPIGSNPWTPIDPTGTGRFRYAFVSNKALQIFDPATSVDSLLWQIPYQNILQASFWGRSTSGVPLVFIVTSDISLGEEPPSTRHMHELLTGTRVSHMSGSAMTQFVLPESEIVGQPILATEVGYRFTFGTPGFSWLHEWRGIDLFDVQGNHLDRLVYWTYDGRYGPYDWAPALSNLQIVHDSVDSSRIALRLYNDNIFGRRTWWLQRLGSWSGGYQLIKTWDATGSSAAAFDLNSNGQPCWLFPLEVPKWERRGLLDGALIDTIPGPANAQLRVCPLTSSGKPDLYYIADSTLYIYQQDINTGILDDPDMPAVPANAVTIIAHPNPFNSAVTFTWTSDLPVSTLTIHNILGHTVRVFDESSLSRSSSLTWNGVDGRGRLVASGVYFARLATKDQVVTAKLVMIR